MGNMSVFSTSVHNPVGFFDTVHLSIFLECRMDIGTIGTILGQRGNRLDRFGYVLIHILMLKELLKKHSTSW